PAMVPAAAASSLVALLALLATASASDVLDLTDADFASKVAGHDMVLVEFFAPWCGHCKRLAPEYEKAATKLKNTVALAKVDCTANTETCNKFGVSGYPTLKIFRDGELSSDYDGPRTADGIVGFLKKQAGPSSVELKTVEDLEKFVGDNDPSIVGFFKDASSDAQTEFMKVASSQRDNYRFAHSNVQAVLDKQGAEEAIVVFRPLRLASKFEETQVTYAEDSYSSAKIKAFIQDNILGICPHLTDDNKDLFKGKDLLVAYYDVDYTKNPKGSNYWRNRVMKVAKKFIEEGHTLSYAIANHKDFGQQLSDYGLEHVSGDVPVVAIKKSNGDKYILREEFTRDGKSLENFLQDYFDGKLKKHLKSEPIPEDNDGPVKVVVAEIFDELVNDESKDVLIEFYAPWCGHCKNLEPKYLELADKLKNDPNILIAKMDATANDVPAQYDVRGFPTIYFSPMGSKDSPKKYEGGREVSDFISYLKREATKKPVVVEEKKEKKKSDDEL
uniref:Protein disulfide-isomerase n=2 Tax=Petromyzon marinus TaxID=7757 RepID=S4RTG1_PETMA